MGKTTNSLLSAGETALEGRVDIEALRTLHLGTCKEFDLPDHTRHEIEQLIDECQDMLNGVRLIQELSPKSLDQLVSYGERCSVRIVAARLNQIGVPAQAFDAWDVGVFTDDNFGDAKLLPSTIDSIKDRFEKRIDPNVVAVVTGFIGKSTACPLKGNMRKLPMITERTPDCAGGHVAAMRPSRLSTMQVTTRAEDHGLDRPISPNPYMRHLFLSCHLLFCFPSYLPTCKFTHPFFSGMNTGHNTKGRITTLGRGGSDLTATAIGAALGVDEVQVWKDVDGILTADPGLVANAIPVARLSYEEASELAYFGAQVLHPIAMQPALKAQIPVRVKNSYNPSAPGSVIDKVGNPERMVTAITCKRGVTLMDINALQMLGTYGFLGAVFADFEKYKVSVDVLASSEVSISVTLDKKQRDDDVKALCKELSKIAEVELHNDRAILTLIADVGRSSDVLATVFRSFSANGIKVEMMSQGASKVNISFIVREDQIENAILKLHSCFFESKCDSGMIEAGQIS